MIPVCRLEDLPEGESVRIDTTPPIAVFHTEDGRLYAIDDTCTHQDASLSEGWLEGCLVECPLHAASFDLRTGEPTCLAGPPSRPYPSRHRRRRHGPRPPRGGGGDGGMTRPTPACAPTPASAPTPTAAVPGREQCIPVPPHAPPSQPPPRLRRALSGPSAPSERNRIA